MNQPSTSRCGLALAWLCLLYSSHASADVLPPEEWACQNKKAGDRCDTGVCRKSTCSRADYAHWDRDAGGGPPTTQYECLLCQDGSVDSADRDAAGHDAADAADAGAAQTRKKSSGCAALSSEQTSRAGALAFAALAGWLTHRRRRTR
jgi:hypothetical protein